MSDLPKMPDFDNDGVSLVLNGNFHTQWEVSIYFEDILVYDNFITGQYDHVPDLTDILSEYSKYIANTMMGFAKFGK